MEPSPRLYEFLEFGDNKQFFGEKRLNKAKDDGYGFLTIGVGHKLTHSELMSGKITIANDSQEMWREGLSNEQIDILLRRDVRWATNTVQFWVEVPLTQGQFDALVSLTFNIGAEAFRRSTLLKLLNQGNYAEVPNQMRRWNRSAGAVSHGLKKRREAEIEYLWKAEY